MQPAEVQVRQGEKVIALVLFALGLYMVWKSFGMPAGTFSTPGPGFFPRVIGVLLAACAAGVFLRSGKGASDPPATTSIGHRDVGLVLLILCVGCYLFMKLGAPVAVGLMSAIILKVLRKTPWWKAALFGVAVGVVSWAAFVWLLEVQLPSLRLP